MSVYAIIGWGSLIWDLENLGAHVDGGWFMRQGPRLPLEFSRVSPKRRMGLAVCLDPQHGDDCASHWIRSRRSTLDEAADDLARRERAVRQRIGAVCLETGVAHGRLDPVVRTVRDWCLTEGLSGAVWTDLESNFEEHLGTGFSVDRGAAYLETLEGESRDEAVRYIDNAPVTTDTPLRRRLETTGWWRAEAERVRRLDRGAGGPLVPR